MSILTSGYNETTIYLWLAIILSGIITFGIRFSLIALFSYREISPQIQQALGFVPPAVLTAIIFPEIFLTGGKMVVPYLNPRFFAGVIAILVAWKTKNTILTIVSGMVAVWLLNMVF